MTFTQETLGFRRRGISPLFSLLMPAFSLPLPPEPLTGTPSSASGTFAYRLTIPQDHQARSFGTMLSPVVLSAHDYSTSELLRTL